MALGQNQGGRDEAFDDARAGCHDPTAPQLLHQRRGDRGNVCGRERDWQQPGQEFAPVTRCEHLETECLTQAVELLAPRLRPGSIGQQRLRPDTQLLGHEPQRRLRDCIT